MTTSHPDFIRISHPCAPGATVDIPWIVFERLVAQGYIVFSTTRKTISISPAGHAMLAQVHQDRRVPLELTTTLPAIPATAEVIG